MDNIGKFEEMILLAVGILHGDAYGLSILEELSNHGRKDVMISSVYKTLMRLEEKGYLVSKYGSSSPIRGGRKKRLYELTSTGKEALREANLIRNKMFKLIPGRVWKPGNAQ